MAAQSHPDLAFLVFYDGDCPFCDNYLKLLRIRDAAQDKVELVNARQTDDARVRELSTLVNLNDGIAVVHGQKIFHAEDAMAVIASLTTSSRLLNRVNAWIFTRPRLSKVVYPILKFGRSVTLKLLGRTEINNSSRP